MAFNRKRSMDDLVKLLAVIICLMPVVTFCTLYVMSFMFAKVGISPPPLQEVKDGLRDIVLMVVGAAAGLAFGAYNKSFRTQQIDRSDDEQTTTTNSNT